MTAGEYVTQKFQSFGITLSGADLLEISLSSGVPGDTDMGTANLSAVTVGVAKLIPQLLLRATSVSESGFSMSWDITGIKQYYAYLCSTYGLKNELDTDKPKITFIQ